jgi:NAD-dependent deacetylase
VSEDLEELIRHAARRLTAARRIVVFTGAGVSKESGIATFRDAEDALWNRYDPMEMATLEGFVRDPEYVWGWYEYRFGLVDQAQPNPGHVAIAAMERLAPEVVVVTQNIDGLHTRAGSGDVVELHGSIRRFRCLDGQHRHAAPAVYSRADLAGQTEKPPRCPRCGQMIRPDVVWFGEQLDEAVVDRAFRLAENCDAMLVVGTSGVVQPAALLPVVAKRARAFVADVNPQRDEIADLADAFLQGPGGEVLPRLFAAMQEQAAQNGIPI